MRFGRGVLQVILVFFIFIYPFFKMADGLNAFFWTELFAASTLFLVFQTLWMSFFSLLLVFFSAVPLALFLHQSKSLFSKWLQIFFKILWVLPTFVIAFVLIETLKFLSAGEIYSLKTILIAWFLMALPFVTLQFISALQDLDPREKEAFKTLGASAWQCFWNYDFIKLRVSFFTTLFQQFWFLITSFSLVVLLGGGPPNETLEVSIYSSLRMIDLNENRACALVCWQMLILLAVRIGLRHFSKNINPSIGVEWSKNLVPASSKSKRMLKLALALLLIASGLWIQDEVNRLNVLCASLSLSLSVAFLSILFSFFLYHLKARFLAEFSAWMSPLILSWAWWKAYAFTAIPSLLLCVGVQVVLFTPWVSRLLFPLFDRSRVHEMEAGRTLGASPMQAWGIVEWPRLKDEFRFVFSWIFSLSLGEVSSVILFSKGDFEPLAVWIQNQFSHFQLEAAGKGMVVLIFYSLFILFFLGKNKGEHVSSH